MSNPNDPPTTAEMPNIGDTLVGKYRIEQILGRGGMGVVAAAKHLQLGQRVAIKFLIQPDHPETVARFLREARAAVRLRSEHVARVLDVGQLENGSPYMVMEYLEGHDLLRHVRTNGPLEVADAVLHVLQTCEAIAEAHAAGIIHRDLKPANLFLTTTPDGESCVKVLDFGISKTNDKADDSGQAFSLTQVDDVLGSPLYMPPEQLKSSKSVDVRSDIWSIGVILYQLLAGQTPWYSNILHELVLSISMDPPPPLTKFRQDVPPALEAAVMKCLEKKREDRFDNVAELAWAISEFGPPRASLSAKRATKLLEASGIHVQTPAGELMAASLKTPTLPSASMPRPATASTADPVTDTVSNVPTVLKTPTSPKQAHSPWFVMAASAGLLVAVGGLAWYFTRGSTLTYTGLPAQAASNEVVSTPIVSPAPDVVPTRDSTIETTAKAPRGEAPSSPVGTPEMTTPMTKTNPPAQFGTNVKKTSAPTTNLSTPNQTAPITQPEAASITPTAAAPIAQPTNTATTPTPKPTTKPSLKELDKIQ